MSARPVILAIDDEPHIVGALERLFKPEYSVCVALSGREGLSKAESATPDLVLLDLNMPGMGGMAVLRRLRKAGKRMPVIIITAYGCVSSAVQAIKLGATDYIEKPFDDTRLKQKALSALAAKQTVSELSRRQGIVGESPQMGRVWDWVDKFGPTDLPILLYGETGTGKELFAKALHQISPRRSGPFVPVDVSTIPESLVESEIFGYNSGAFTGASRNKPGRLEWANGGVLFLDEVGNLPLSCQAKLLRTLQEERYIPLGGRAPKAFEARLLSATNTDLGNAIEHGRFREDLYYRISGVTIQIPPLRDREGDIELLASFFLDKYARKYDKPSPRLSASARKHLLTYGWPGNVRELEHAVASAVIIADRIILADHLSFRRPNATVWPRSLAEAGQHIGSPAVLRGACTGEDVFEVNFTCDFDGPIDLKRIKKQVAAESERLVIAEAEKRLSLNRTELAKYLSIDPKTLRSKVKGNGTPARV